MRAPAAIAILALTAGCGRACAPAASAPRADDGVAPARGKARAVIEPGTLPGRYACEVEGAVGDCYVRVPAGTFLMGAQAADPSAPAHDEHARTDEGPPHRVTLPAYRILRREVSVRTFFHCVKDGWCAEDDVADVNALRAIPEDLSSLRPLTGLSWTGAARVCRWLGGRLPTEAEWERAARGDDGRRFPWGDDPGCGIASRTATMAGSDMVTERCENDDVAAHGDLRGASPLGVQGMAGNVWEWTADWYGADAYARGDVHDPRGPAVGTARVQRGGGWTSVDAWELRSAARGSLEPGRQLPDVGVRCARDEDPSW